MSTTRLNPYPPDDQAPRNNTSTRRYRPTDEYDTAATTWRGTVDDVLDDIGDGYDVEPDYVQPVPVRRRPSSAGTSTMSIGQDFAHRRPRRRHTDTDPQVDQRYVNTMPSRVSRRLFWKKLVTYSAGGVLGLAGLTATLGTWLNSELVHMNEQFTEGRVPNASISVVVGHADSATKQTVIHAFLDGDHITVLELPGGDAAKAGIFQTPSLRQGTQNAQGYQGDLSQVYLSLNDILVGGGKHQILLIAKCGGVGMLQSSVTMLWILVDNGKGHFVGVNPTSNNQ